jgi:hypothetical protein
MWFCGDRPIDDLRLTIYELSSLRLQTVNAKMRMPYVAVHPGGYRTAAREALVAARKRAGGEPNSRLKARLKDASDS